MPKPSEWKKTAKAKGVKTSLEMPADVWREAKIFCLDHAVNFQDLVAEAVREYLKARKGRKSRKPE
jgi:hypothetical protein